MPDQGIKRFWYLKGTHHSFEYDCKVRNRTKPSQFRKSEKKSPTNGSWS
jgi:hypothetical protein